MLTVEQLTIFCLFPLKIAESTMMNLVVRQSLVFVIVIKKYQILILSQKPLVMIVIHRHLLKLIVRPESNLNSSARYEHWRRQNDN